MTPLLMVVAQALTMVSAGFDAHSTDRPVKPAPAAHRPSDVAPAQPAKPAAVTSVAGDVVMLHGTNDGSGIDAKIGKVVELSKPPFSSYNSYKLLSRQNAQFQRGTASAFTLPTKRELRIVFKDVIEPQKKDEAKRYVITASIQKPDGKTFLPLVEVNAKAGETFWVAGQDYNGGILVIGIKINP